MSFKKWNAILIDHNDSFTHNVKSWLSQDFAVQIINYDELEFSSIENWIENFDLFVFSPGPKNPIDYPNSLKLISKIYSKKAILGICLGLQLIIHFYEGKVAPYQPPVHGKKSCLKSIDTSFNSIQGLNVGRYHSLFCISKSDSLKLVAVTQKDEMPMIFFDEKAKIMGYQFHPESFLTDDGNTFLKLVIQKLLE